MRKGEAAALRSTDRERKKKGRTRVFADQIANVQMQIHCGECYAGKGREVDSVQRSIQ